MPKGDAKPGEHVDPRGRMPCLWTGEGGNGLWPDAGNWKGGRIPGSSDVVRLVAFSGPATIAIPNTATIGRLEVELQDAEATVILTGNGTLVVTGVDHSRGKPTTLQVMSGTLEIRHPITVEIEGPRFSAWPGGHLRLSSPTVYATIPDLKLAMSQTGRMTLAVPYWEPNMDWDISTSSTQGLGHRIVHYDHDKIEGPIGFSFNKFKEHDADILLITGFRDGDYLRFTENPMLSTDPGKHLRLEGIRFDSWPHQGAAEIAQKDGYWYFVPQGTAVPDTRVHASDQQEAAERAPVVHYPEVHITPLETTVPAPASADHPRNMGGDLARLSDGRWLLAYSQWTTGTTDADASRVVGRLSHDQGTTWGETFVIAAPNETRDTVRMPNFVRLGDGRLALFVRCHQTMDVKWISMMTCRDETAELLDASTWSAPRRVTPAPPGGHVIIAARVIRTRGGRLIVPFATPWPWDRTDGRADRICTSCMLSDDDGKSWFQSRTTLRGPGRGLMEPAVVEFTSGRLMMLMRTQTHRQYISYSEDDGNTWTKATEVTRLTSPESPAALAIEPNTGWVMVVWNRNSNLGTMSENRAPLTVGFSHDEGESWFGFQSLEDEARKSWSYPTIRFLDDFAHVLYYERTETERGETRISLKMQKLAVGPG